MGSAFGPYIALFPRTGFRYAPFGYDLGDMLVSSPPDVGRLVKIFMRRGCSIGVSRRDVLDSGCHGADRAQAEQERGTAERCPCLGWLRSS